jgi:glycogen operon protein
MATLFVAQGVPMLEMGDELWRTQRGNNNPYCHDSELTWVDWNVGPDALAMLEHVRKLAALRKEHAAFRHRNFLGGEDIRWLRPEGGEMTQHNWLAPERATLAFHLVARGEDDGFVVLMNGERTAQSFALPPGDWRVVLDTAEGAPHGQVVRGSRAVEGSSLVLLVS